MKFKMPRGIKTGRIKVKTGIKRPNISRALRGKKRGGRKRVKFY